MSRPSDGWPPAVLALGFGLLSGLSFPLGAAVGVWATPPPSKQGCRYVAHIADLEGKGRSSWIAGMLAFGAGLLLFAVTVDLYGAAMAELNEMKDSGHTDQGVRAIFVTIFFAFLGAAGYVASNRGLQLWLMPPEQGDKAAGVSASSRQPESETTPLLVRSTSEAELERHVVKSMMVGMESWFGVFISGVPEGLLLGSFAAEKRISVVFVISLLVSNFPTALASASLLRQGGRSALEIMGLWTFVFVFTGLLAGVWPMISHGYPSSQGMQVVSSAVEGLAGGSMLACILAVMLPEAYLVQGDIAGLVTVSGFLAAVCLKVFGGLVEDWMAHEPFDVRIVRDFVAGGGGAPGG
mmetsp:Transcript_99877/g.286968  ORF Transcript_99877/g.286968 Transcript_99877/m.286968 type:complete len:352 (+) Transcript_99877:111-1166(+)